MHTLAFISIYQLLLGLFRLSASVYRIHRLLMEMEITEFSLCMFWVWITLKIVTSYFTSLQRMVWKWDLACLLQTQACYFKVSSKASFLDQGNSLTL